MADDEFMKPEEAEKAIARAMTKTPQVTAVRNKLQKLVEDDDKGLQMLASAIRRLLHEG
jgi:polysaccharide deacetylase 2 family uncharacterized protein YibQ